MPFSQSLFPIKDDKLPFKNGIGLDKYMIDHTKRFYSNQFNLQSTKGKKSHHSKYQKKEYNDDVCLVEIDDAHELSATP